MTKTSSRVYIWMWVRLYLYSVLLWARVMCWAVSFSVCCLVRAGPGGERGGGQRCHHGPSLQVHLRQGPHRPHPYLRYPLPHLPPRSALALVPGPWSDADEPPAGQHPARRPARTGRQTDTKIHENNNEPYMNIKYLFSLSCLDPVQQNHGPTWHLCL